MPACIPDGTAQPCSKWDAGLRKKWELSTTKLGTIAARRELSKTAKKRTKQREKPTRNYGSRATAGPPLGMTIATLWSAPMWRRPLLEKRASWQWKTSRDFLHIKLILKKKCPKCSWPIAFGTHRKPSAIDNATRQRWTQTMTGRRNTPMQHTTPVPPTGICRPLANGLACPYSLDRYGVPLPHFTPYATSTTLNLLCRESFGTALP